MTSPSEPTAQTRRALGVDAHAAAISSRREHFLTLYNFSEGHGLEIGPLDSAISDASLERVAYVDVFDTDGIRSHYANDENVLIDLIPEIDYPLYVDGGMRTLAEAAAPGAPFDWVIASHVIEHVPDVIGWLRQVAELAADDGALILAVPDRRYCFDRHRPPTTTGQAIQAYESADSRPSIRAVYDFFTTAVAVDTGALWAGRRPPGFSARMHDRATVTAMMERCRAGEYVDCHVWTFTPESFVEQVRELRHLGLCDWYVEKLVPVVGGLEFHAVLRRLRRDGSSADVDLEEPEAGSDMPDWLFDEWTARADVRRQSRKIRRLRKRNRRLRRERDALAGSRRMRVGSVIVEPLARIRRVLRRGASGM